MVKPGSPGATSTSTPTIRPVMPLRGADSRVASTEGPVAAATHPRLTWAGSPARGDDERSAPRDRRQLRHRGAFGAIDGPRKVEHGPPQDGIGLADHERRAAVERRDRA